MDHDEWDYQKGANYIGDTLFIIMKNPKTFYNWAKIQMYKQF